MYKSIVTPHFIRWVKVAVALAALFWLLTSFYKDADLFAHIFAEKSGILFSAMAIVFMLTWLNLYFEVRKWYTLLGAKGLSIASGFRQILSGMSSGFITPNRLGEFAGRMLYLPKQYRPLAPVSALAGAFVQGSITVTFGVFAMWFFPMYPADLDHLSFPYFGVILFASIFCVLLIFWKKSGSRHRKLLKSAAHMRSLPLHRWMWATGWATLRYVVFASQFVVSLYLLGYDGALPAAYSGVFLLYFCQSFIPGPAFGELGVREILAVVIFGHFMPHPVLAAAAGFTVWIANIAIPVLAGASLVGYSAHHGRS